jgi:hypothetical protein
LRERKPASRSTSASPARPDDQRARDAALEQTHAAQDQRAHDALTELGFRDQHVAQPSATHDQRLDRLHARARRRATADRELVQLADEVARAVRDDRLLATERVVLRDRDFAGEAR